MNKLAYSLVVLTAIGGAGLLSASGAVAGVNVNETGNAVLCKGKTCTWLKPACQSEGGTYTEGAGGTGKCNFPGKADMGFTAVPKDTQTRVKIQN